MPIQNHCGSQPSSYSQAAENSAELQPSQTRHSQPQAGTQFGAALRSIPLNPALYTQAEHLNTENAKQVLLSNLKRNMNAAIEVSSFKHFQIPDWVRAAASAVGYPGHLPFPCEMSAELVAKFATLRELHIRIGEVDRLLDFVKHADKIMTCTKYLWLALCVRNIYSARVLLANNSFPLFPQKALEIAAEVGTAYIHGKIFKGTASAQAVIKRLSANNGGVEQEDQASTEALRSEIEDNIQILQELTNKSTANSTLYNIAYAATR